MRTFLRGCATLVLALVLLAASAYVAYGLRGAAEVSRAEQQAADDLAEAMPRSQHRVTRARDAVRAAAAARWGAPAYAWQEVTCRLDSRDAGLMVESYEQECQLHAVDLLPVDLLPVDRADGDGCESLSLRRLQAPDGGGLPAFGLDVRRGPTSAFAEDRPYENGCPDGVLAPAWDVTARLVSGSRPTDLSEAPAWVVVDVFTDVSRTDLGCSPWWVVLCDAPVDRPVIGDLD